MNFLAPYMLWGAAAASVPVLIHLFFRSRYRTVPWAAMKFLLTSVEQTSRRMKFQELLLLLLRCAVLALLAVALARPLSSAFTSGPGGGQGEAVDAVFVLDTSFSMGAKEGDETRFTLARAAALEALDRLPPYSTVQVVACADRAEVLGPRNPGNLDLARQIIERLPLTSLKSDLLPGVQEAQALLKRSQLFNKELYVFSDMQKPAWEAQADPLVRTLREIDETATVYLVRCGAGTPRNVAVTAITPQSGMPRPGERVGFAVLVANTGAEAVKDVEVTLTLDGRADRAEKQSVAELRPGEYRAVTLTAQADEPGLHVVTAVAGPDDLDGDNRRDQVINVRDFVRVLVVDGAPSPEDPARSASYYLMHALLPVSDTEKGRYHLQPTLVHPRQASPEFLKDQDLCVLVNVALENKIGRDAQPLSPEFLDELERFVREGRGLLIFAGDNTDPQEYTRVLVDNHRLLPAPLTGVERRDTKTDGPLHFNRNSAALPAFQRFKEDDYYKFLDGVEVWQALTVAEKAADKKKTEPAAGEEKKADEQPARAADGVTVALRYDNGLPAVVAHRVDGGQVLLVTTAASPGKAKDSPDPTWNNWALFPFYPPMVELALNHLLQQQSQSHNVVAGTALGWFAPADEANLSFVLYGPDGGKRRLGLPSLVRERPLLTLDGLPAAGVYRLAGVKNTEESLDVLNDPILVEELRKGTAKVGRPFAVTPDLAESADLQALTDAQLDDSLGFRVVHVTAGGQATSAADLDRTNREWTLWLLAAVLVLTFGEAILAWFCGRPIGVV